MARLVHRRLLLDVVLPDFSAIVANAYKQPDPEASLRAHVKDGGHPLALALADCSPSPLARSKPCAGGCTSPSTRAFTL